jgi:hypothetical protein
MSIQVDYISSYYMLFSISDFNSGETMKNTQYVKVKLQLTAQQTKMLWAEKTILDSGLIRYTKCTMTGEINPNYRIEVFYAHINDVIWEKGAKLNLKYNLLELV